MKIDGSPQVTPTWIDIVENENEGEHQEIILIKTAKDRIKQKNVSRDPRISISIVDEDNPYSMVTIKGRVIEQTTKGADEHIDKLAKRYLNAERYPANQASDVIKISELEQRRCLFMEV
ncbi:MAG: pyridoxamine 5'-phosphate oxidase family protein [Candidatus Nitrosopolaris sp.]